MPRVRVARAARCAASTVKTSAVMSQNPSLGCSTCMTVVALRSKTIVCRLSLAAFIAVALGGGVCCQAADANSATAPTSREALIAQARDLQAHGHRIEALSVCQALLRRWPGDPAGRLLRGGLLVGLGGGTQALLLARWRAPPP